MHIFTSFNEGSWSVIEGTVFTGGSGRSYRGGGGVTARVGFYKGRRRVQIGRGEGEELQLERRRGRSYRGKGKELLYVLFCPRADGEAPWVEKN